MPGENVIKGPLVEATVAGAGVGLVGGYVVGAITGLFREVDPIRWSGHGAALVGVFAAFLVLWPRIGL